MVVSGILHVTSLESVSADDKVGALIMKMKETKFVPERLEVKVGETVRIVLKNNDFATHTFHVHDMGIEHTVIPFSEELIEFRPTKLGKLAYHCDVDGHDDMKGTLVVVQ